MQQSLCGAQRMQAMTEKLLLLAETNVERILAIAEQQQPQVMVIDSVQTI